MNAWKCDYEKVVAVKTGEGYCLTPTDARILDMDGSLSPIFEASTKVSNFSGRRNTGTVSGFQKYYQYTAVPVEESFSGKMNKGNKVRGESLNRTGFAVSEQVVEDVGDYDYRMRYATEPAKEYSPAQLPLQEVGGNFGEQFSELADKVGGGSLV